MRLIALAAALLSAFAPPATAQSALDYAGLRGEAAQLLSEYIRINTSNPPGNELATARWLKNVLAREGIDGQILDTAELGAGRANFSRGSRGAAQARRSPWCTTWMWCPRPARIGDRIHSAGRSRTDMSGDAALST